MLILQGVGGLGQRLGMLILWGRGRGGWGTDIRDFIFWEGWFRAGGLWANIGDVNNGAGGGSETDIGLFIVLGAGEFWARDWGC